LFAEDLTIIYKIKQSGPFGSFSYISTQYYSAQYYFSQDSSPKLNENLAAELIDYVNSVRYTIDHRNKTIKKYTLECAIGYYETLAKAKLEAPEKFAELDEEMKSFMGKGNILDIVMKSIIGEDDMPTVAKTGAEKILGRKCEKRKATFGGISIEESIDPTLIPPIIQNKDEFNSLLSYLSKVMLKFSDELRKPEGGTPLKFRI